MYVTNSTRLLGLRLQTNGPQKDVSSGSCLIATGPNIAKDGVKWVLCGGAVC